MKNKLLFLGAPGAGKGTQASIICSTQRLLHLSTGELLRAEVSAQTDIGKEVDFIMNSGELVSDEIVLSIVEKKLLKDAQDGWLLDGFPRNLLQAQSLQKLLTQISQPIEAVVLIEINDDALLERLLLRGRPDDTEEVIRNRLKVYREKTAPLIKFYDELGILETVNGQDDIEDVALRIREVLK